MSSVIKLTQGWPLLGRTATILVLMVVAFIKSLHVLQTTTAPNAVCPTAISGSARLQVIACR